MRKSVCEWRAGEENASICKVSVMMENASTSTSTSTRRSKRNSLEQPLVAPGSHDCRLCRGVIHNNLLLYAYAAELAIPASLVGLL
jgi:hypothetical protein